MGARYRSNPRMNRFHADTGEHPPQKALHRTAYGKAILAASAPDTPQTVTTESVPQRLGRPSNEVTNLPFAPRPTRETNIPTPNTPQPGTTASSPPQLDRLNGKVADLSRAAAPTVPGEIRYDCRSTKDLPLKTQNGLDDLLHRHIMRYRRKWVSVEEVCEATDETTCGCLKCESEFAIYSSVASWRSAMDRRREHRFLRT